LGPFRRVHPQQKRQRGTKVRLRGKKVEEGERFFVEVSRKERGASFFIVLDGCEFLQKESAV